MKPLPWRRIKFWTCIRCGECCALTVQLTMREWLDLTKMYGYSIADQDIGGFFLRKTIDKECPFLSSIRAGSICGLQNTKPLACKIWPFRILAEPKYGEDSEALFKYRNERFYVYVIPNCPGITWGTPTENFFKKILPELIGIRLGFFERQHFTTSS